MSFIHKIRVYLRPGAEHPFRGDESRQSDPTRPLRETLQRSGNDGASDQGPQDPFSLRSDLVPSVRGQSVPPVPALDGLYPESHAAEASSAGNTLGPGAVRHDPAASSQFRRSDSATSDAGQDASADLVLLAGGLEKSVRFLPSVAVKPGRP